MLCVSVCSAFRSRTGLTAEVGTALVGDSLADGRARNALVCLEGLVVEPIH